MSEDGSSWRKLFAVLLLIALGIGIGLWIDPGESPEVANPQPVESSVGNREVNGVPLGYSRTERGAVEAATNFSRVLSAVPNDVTAYLAAADTMAAPEYQADARRLARNAFTFLTERYGPGGSFMFAPLRYRVASYSDAEATISVWGVTLATGDKTGGIEESWLTGTLDLVWVDGDWRISGQQSETGPTPELLQTNDSLPTEALGGFEEYTDAPRP